MGTTKPRYEAVYVAGLDIYGIVDTTTGMFEPYLYFTDAVSAVEQEEFMNDSWEESQREGS